MRLRIGRGSTAAAAAASAGAPRWLLGLALVATLPVGAFHLEALADLPYVWLTGFSRQELERLAYLPPSELHSRVGLREFPGGFHGEGATTHDRAAHVIASYLGTRRWGPDVTLAFGYLKEYVPALLRQGRADPDDIAANYAGVRYALEERERRR